MTEANGDVGIFPGAALTGFPPGTYSGTLSLANQDANNAQSALTAAYVIIAAKAHNTDLSDQDLGGMTLLPGIYKFGSNASLTGELTLDADGDAAAVWMFQIGDALNFAGSSSIVFENNLGNPDFVYWQVGTSATIGTSASIVGNILA